MMMKYIPVCKVLPDAYHLAGTGKWKQGEPLFHELRAAVGKVLLQPAVFSGQNWVVVRQGLERGRVMFFAEVSRIVDALHKLGFEPKALEYGWSGDCDRSPIMQERTADSRSQIAVVLAQQALRYPRGRVTVEFDDMNGGNGGKLYITTFES